CIRAGPGSLCVVAPDTNDLELRKIAVLFVLAELFEPAIDAVVVANLKVASREGHTEVPFQRALIRKVLTLWLVVSRALGVAATAGLAFPRAHVLAIAPVRNPGALAVVPYVTAGRTRDLLASLVVIRTSA